MRSKKKASTDLAITKMVVTNRGPGKPTTVTAEFGAGETVRLIFPASRALADRIDEEWHRRRLRSRAETIRVLLEEALKEKGR